MKIKEGFELRTICGEHVIVGTGRKNIDFSRIISLNESAAQVWQFVKDKDFELGDMVKVLLDNYEVEEATAQKDAEALLTKWKEIGLI